MNAKLNVSRIARNYGTLFAYIIMLLVFSILAPSAFPTLSNVISILRQIAMLATISLGLTFVLITKRSDLSIGYSTSFLGIVVAGMNIWLAALITVLLGALIGLINGVVIAYLGVPDFIASLGVGYVVAGINQAYTKGHPISNLPADFEIFGAQRLGGVIPNAVIIMLIVLVVSSIILNQTKLGRYIYGVGLCFLRHCLRRHGRDADFQTGLCASSGCGGLLAGCYCGRMAGRHRFQRR